MSSRETTREVIAQIIIYCMVIGLLLLVLVQCNQRREDQCRERGGTVVTGPSTSSCIEPEGR